MEDKKELAVQGIASFLASPKILSEYYQDYSEILKLISYQLDHQFVLEILYPY